MIAFLERCITMTHDTKKTKKFRLRKIFRPNLPLVNKKDTKVSISTLRKMVTTKEQEDILRRIEHETIPSVRDAWINYFLKITKRSQCKSDLLKK
ncbi:unnamed protein product [marine sediment metagenome]|uniref:Uncharacterized protein n=1 Tax=marine sediment metagenome TaxID=412755 RepID=X0V9W0_9ZZZZ